MPDDLPVLSVVGLNTFQRFSTPSRSWTKTRAPSLLSPLATLPNLFATTPQSLWSVYDQPDAYRGVLPKGVYLTITPENGVPRVPDLLPTVPKPK